MLIYLRANLTTRALAALVRSSQSSVDRAIRHLVPVLAQALRPVTDHDSRTHSWIVDGTLIPVPRLHTHPRN